MQPEMADHRDDFGLQLEKLLGESLLSFFDR